MCFWFPLYWLLSLWEDPLPGPIISSSKPKEGRAGQSIASENSECCSTWPSAQCVQSSSARVLQLVSDGI